MTRQYFRIIALAISVALCCILSTGCRFHKAQVDRIRAEIPAAIEFIESSDEFLNLLLDIKERVRMLNLVNSNTLYADELFLENIDFTIYNDELEILVFFEEANIRGRTNLVGSKFDLLTLSEIDTIELRLLELISNNYNPSFWISADEISFTFTEYERAFLHIEHPSVDFELGNSDTYQYYEYSERVTDDWCVRICKLDYY